MPNPTLKELKPRDFDYWKANHLINRAGFGATPTQIASVHKLGLDEAVDYLVDFHKLSSTPVRAEAFDRNIMRPATAEERRMAQEARRTNNEELRTRLQMERQQRQIDDRRQMSEIQKWWLKRIIETSRPLEEKLTLFWHGHFAASYRGVEDSYHMFVQNQFFRTNAAGNFAELVTGIIRDPAMLKYLNNDQNRRERPNENLARELMELFTLGEGNGYTEADIKEGARALTGYAFDDDAFVFRQPQHDAGNKRIFGQAGQWNGPDFCRLILQQKVCSEFICWKLYRFFVNDLPGVPGKETQQFIVKLAELMRRHEYEIKPVLKALFKSEHFYDAANRASVIKSPIQLVVHALRSLRTPARNLAALANATDLMGQNLFFPPSVKGWDGGRSWINTSTLFVRQNLLVYLLTGRKPDGFEWDADGELYDPTHLIAQIPESGGNKPNVQDVVMYLLQFNLGTTPHPDRVQTLMNYVEKNGNTIDDRMIVSLLALIAAMPEYQLC